MIHILKMTVGNWGVAWCPDNLPSQDLGQILYKTILIGNRLRRSPTTRYTRPWPEPPQTQSRECVVELLSRQVLDEYERNTDQIISAMSTGLVPGENYRYNLDRNMSEALVGGVWIPFMTNPPEAIRR